jgi:hypothetical protein
MAKSANAPCEECFHSFPRYDTICDACGFERWARWLHYVAPNPENGEYGEEATGSIHARGLTLCPVEPGSGVARRLRVKPRQSGLVLLVRGSGPEEGSWEAINRPLGKVLVRPIGYFWEHSGTGEEVPDHEFPPTGRRVPRKAAATPTRELTPVGKRGSGKAVGRPQMDYTRDEAEVLRLREAGEKDRYNLSHQTGLPRAKVKKIVDRQRKRISRAQNKKERRTN